MNDETEAGNELKSKENVVHFVDKQDRGLPRHQTFKRDAPQSLRTSLHLRFALSTNVGRLSGP